MKLLGEFGLDRRNRDGRHRRCRGCQNEYQQQRRADPAVRAREAEGSRQRHRTNPELRAKKTEQQRHRYADPESGQAERLRQRHAAWRAQVLAHYSPTSPPSCACCGATERLSIDHVNGDGGDHRQELFGDRRLSARAFYIHLVNAGFPSDPPLQVLCSPCNSSKAGGPRCRLLHMEPLPFLVDWLAAQAAGKAAAQRDSPPRASASVTPP